MTVTWSMSLAILNVFTMCTIAGQKVFISSVVEMGETTAYILGKHSPILWLQRRMSGF